MGQVLQVFSREVQSRAGDTQVVRMSDADTPHLARLCDNDPTIKNALIFSGRKPAYLNYEDALRNMYRQAELYPSMRHYTIHDRDEITGYVYAGSNPSDSQYMLDCWVGLPYRRQGIASRALRKTMDAIWQKNPKAGLSLGAKDLIAQAFLEKTGFLKPIGSSRYECIRKPRLVTWYGRPVSPL